MKESPQRTPEPARREPAFRIAGAAEPPRPFPAASRGAAAYDRLREQLGELELQTDLWWLVMMVSGLAAALLAALAFPDHGLFWAYLTVFLRVAIAIGLAQQPWGGIFGKLLSLGLVAGLFVIFADYMAVHWFRAGQLSYPAGQALVLATPVYVILSWGLSFVEFGYAILRIFGILARKFPGETGRVLTMAAGGAVAAVTIGCLEFLATTANWWSYKAGHAVVGNGFAIYVVVAKFFVFMFFLPIFARYLASTQGRVYASLRYGMILGGIIFLSYAVSYLLVMGFFV